jgi:predicted transcriptional regulator
MEEKIPALELETRKKIFQLILKSPGLHFRELQRRSGLVTGELQYHLDYLKKRSLVTEDKDRDYSRFFVIDKLDEKEKKILSFLRQSTIRKIIFFVMENPKCNHKTITGKVGISPSTASWHLKRLVEAELLKDSHKGRESYFVVSNPELIAKLLIRYRRSFLDTIVDTFIASWTS